MTFLGNGHFLVQTELGVILLVSTMVGHSSIQKACQKFNHPLWIIALISMIGCFIQPQIIPPMFKLDDCISSMVGEEKALFISFVRRMLQWLPEDRDTAKELRKDPWLQSGLT